MSILSSLNFVTDTPISVDPLTRARQNFLIRIDDQIEVAEAHQKGETLIKNTTKTIVDRETGRKEKIEVPRQLKLWWKGNPENGFIVTPRIGFARIELVKDKPGISAKDNKEVVKVLQTLKSAAEAGELDETFSKEIKRRKRKTL